MEPQLSIFDAPRSTPTEELTGEQRKDAGIAQVLRNGPRTFVERASAAIKAAHAGQQILAEQWRITCEEQGITPDHVNGWGALTNALARRGVIRGTGIYQRCKSKSRHANPSQVWEVIA